MHIVFLGLLKKIQGLLINKLMGDPYISKAQPIVYFFDKARFENRSNKITGLLIWHI